MRNFWLLVFCALSLPVHADYSTHPRANELLEKLAVEHHFSAEQLHEVRQALVQAQRIPKLVAAEQNSAEKVETWTTYATKRVDPVRIRLGAEFIEEHRATLAEAENQYGVPGPIIAGILGIETNFGRFTGSTRVLDALATQGFDHPRRSDFFFSELLQFFVFCRDTGTTPTQPLGSYAGAMGWAQFMPSNYRRLAVDFNQDGQTNLWQAKDAIGSIAHYLVAYDRKRSWQRGQPLMVPATLETALPAGTPVNGARVTHDIASVRAMGLKPSVDLPPGTPVGIVELKLDNGVEYWLGMHNFYSIMSYNPRVYYAMTVAQLAAGMGGIDAERTGQP
tara:strand:+ start:1297 stop:2301 length:1005 start_codon:yes stop_codon:yes gene_type:complete